MLRSLIQPENELIKLCQSQEWEKVKVLVANSPTEATPSAAACRGLANTALVSAIHNSAPLEVLKVLISTNSDQLMTVRHHRNGNALHEAIKHKASMEVIIFLINQIMKFEQESGWLYTGELKPVTLDLHTLSSKNTVMPSKKEHNYDDIALTAKFDTQCTLFNQIDHLRRTPLHYLVDRFSKESGESRDLVTAIHLLVQVFPPAVAKLDTDGLTPLDICLISPQNTNSLRAMEVEMKVFSLVKMMIKAYPPVAFPSINSAQATVCSGIDMVDMYEGAGIHNLGSFLIVNSRRLLKNTMEGHIAHNTLSHALMHGRHCSTIELLIGASKTKNPSWYTGHLYDWDEFEIEPPDEENESCMTIVSNDFEVPLHIAVTMRSSPEVVTHVVKSGPDASYIPDRCGLTPVCWSWIRFVIDEIEKDNREADDENENIIWTQPIVKSSKRRFLPSNFLDFHADLTDDLLKNVVEFMGVSDSIPASCLRHIHHMNIEKRNLWTKLSCLLPNAAKACAQNEKPNDKLFMNLDKIIHWSPVHAASYINCPRAVLLNAILNSPACLKSEDELGNLPIHYAAACQGYSKTLPIGVTFAPKIVQEKSRVFDIVPLHPDCTKSMNSSMQLPLHIAIDAEKEARVTMKNGNGLRRNRINRLQRMESKRPRIFDKRESIDNSPVLFLVNAYIESLEQPDGRTHLYPFMQAAGKNYYF